MKCTLIMMALCWCPLALAQPYVSDALKFDQRIANCEGKWFGAKGQGEKIVLGYAYMDPSEGFTFEHYGSLDTSAGNLRAVPSDTQGKARLISRVDRNFPASCLTDAQVASLGLPSSPESMQYYKDDLPAAEHHSRWAYFYNQIGASDIALDHVSKATAAGASSAALTFEHAYALNALKRFDETISLLTPVASSRDASSDLIAELAFAYLELGQYRRAIAFYTKAIDHAVPSQRRWEFARNVAGAYEHLGDIKQRDRWMELSNRYRGDTP